MKSYVENILSIVIVKVLSGIGCRMFQDELEGSIGQGRMSYRESGYDVLRR